MPKRHRQPEPIDIGSTAHRSHPASSSPPNSKNAFSQSTTTSNVTSSSLAAKASGAPAPDAKPVYSPGELKLAEETRRKAMDFPATPETLTRHRRQQEADAKRRRVSYDHDGQPLIEADAETPAIPNASTAPARGAGSGVDAAAGKAGHAEEEEEEEADEQSDLSSKDYIGDDGNQPTTDSEMDSDDDTDGESELRGLRKAVEAAAAQRRRRAGEGDSESAASTSSGPEDDSASSDFDDEDDEDEEDDDDAAAALGDSDEDEEGDSDDEEDSDDDMSMEEGEEDEDEEGSSLEGAARRRKAMEEDEEDDSEGGLITVDFGVFDMEASNIDGIIHLMDQLCPDKMNEVDRDDLGLALFESPFTSVVRLQNNGEDATGEEEQEFYGLSSVLDVAHGQHLYPKALRPLSELLQQHVWRQAAPGLPPTDILTSVVDDEHPSTSRAKCLLLVSEYIRNIPLELTVQIFDDVLDRLEAAGKEAKAQKQKTGATHEDPIFATQPSMLAVLAKVQRATDAPVTLPKGGKTSQQGGAEGEAGAQTQPNASPAPAKKRGGHSKQPEKAAAAGGSGAMAAPEAPLDLANYIFWREEDSILYEFRDTRVAALVYRCRPQYDGQPEHEIPLSIFFVLQHGAMRQAVDEMKRRQTVNAAIERY